MFFSLYMFFQIIVIMTFVYFKSFTSIIKFFTSIIIVYHYSKTIRLWVKDFLSFFDTFEKRRINEL